MFFFTERNAAGKDIFYQKNMTNCPQSPHQEHHLVKEHLNMLLPFLGTVTKLSESFELASPDAFKVVLNDLGKTGHLAVDFFMLMNVSAFHLSSF